MTFQGMVPRKPANHIQAPVVPSTRRGEGGGKGGGGGLVVDGLSILLQALMYSCTSTIQVAARRGVPGVTAGAQVQQVHPRHGHPAARHGAGGALLGGRRVAAPFHQPVHPPVLPASRVSSLPDHLCHGACKGMARTCSVGMPRCSPRAWGPAGGRRNL